MVGWLTGYSNRLKLTIDSGDITAALTHFPLRVHLSSSSGINSFDATDIFDEIGANNLKLAVTKDDGTTECYVEIDNWDSSAETADLWVSKSDLVISDSADTVLYLYYDSSVANNTTYVGVTDSVVAENVWDANFKLVCHMSDATTSTVKDSTSNDNDGTKTGANNPLEISGIIGKGQLLRSDVLGCINLGADLLHPSAFTISCIVKNTDRTAQGGAVGIFVGTFTGWGWIGYLKSTGELGFGRDVFIGSGYILPESDNLGYHLSATYDGTTLKMYVNGNEEYSGLMGNINPTGNTWIGCNTDLNCAGASIDEVQISYNSTRSVAWVGASYETQRDHIITFGVDFGTTGESLYYYRDRFWTHLPKPEPVPDVPDPSTIDWSIGAIEKAKLDRDAEELLGLNKKIRKIREQEWLDHVRNTE